MRSTIYEVDEDVFQITTEHDDGSVTVEMVFGREAYEAHAQKDMNANGQRDEHTASYASTGRIARVSNHSRLLN